MAALRIVFSVALIALAPAAAARTRAVGSWIDRADRILVIIAHPDDEVLIAPLLAARCVRGGASCSILVMTSGENGTCALPEGCAPDLGSVRAAEMARSAALLNARLTQWTYPDAFSDVATAWAAHAGSRETLVLRLADVIASEDPALIITFDPRHGTTCHPAHREIGGLVVETGAPRVVFIATAARFVGFGFELWNGGGAASSVYVARGDWDFAVRVAETHASQFTAAQLESLRTISAAQRRVWLIPTGAASTVRCDD